MMNFNGSEGAYFLIAIIAIGWILGILMPEIRIRQVVAILRIKGPLTFVQLSKELGMGFRVENVWLKNALQILKARGDIESLERNGFRWSVKNNRGLLSAAILRTWYLIVLPPMDIEDQKAAAILACTSWLGTNRKSVAQHLGDATIGASKKENRFFVSIAVNSGSYQYFYFLVELPKFTFTQVSIQLHRETK